MDTAESVLIERLKSDDDGAYREINMRYYKPLKSVAYKIVFDVDHAEDIVNETFLSFRKSIENFRAGSNIFTYLYRIAVNKSIDLSRKLKRERLKQQNISISSSESDSDINIIVQEALAMLDDEFRIPLIMCEIENQSYEDIARSLDIPLNTVRSRIYRSRKKLVDIFNQMGVEL